MTDGSLKGIRVIDLTVSVAGPFATQILGDLGAEVIKVERPILGDDTRRWGPPFWGDDSATFQGLNRNKRSLAIDLKGDTDRQAFWELVADADVLVQNLRPGTLSRLGFGWEESRARNPRLIYCEITGYGAKGPLKDRPAYDPLVQAFAGLMSLTGEAGGTPARIPASILDQGSGMWAVIGILDALRRRDVSGEGSHIQTSLLETALMWLPGQFVGYFAERVVPPRLGSGTVGIAPYQAFPTADSWIIVAAGNDNLWGRLCAAIDQRALLDDERFTSNPDRVMHRDALGSELSRVFRLKKTAHWLDVLSRVGVPAAPIQTIDQVVQHEQVEALGAFRPVDHPSIPHFRLVSTPVQVDGEYYPVRTPPPALDEARSDLLDSEGHARPRKERPVSTPVRRVYRYPRVTLIEEAMREGFQIERADIPVDDKLRVLDALSRTGLQRIVVGSFVSPRWTPQMANIDELVSRMKPVKGVTYTALALNDRGRERMAAHIPPLSLPSELPETLVHACDVFAQRNTGRTQQAEIDGWAAVVAAAVKRGARQAGIGVNAAWGSNWLGDITLDERMNLLRRQHELWTANGIAVTKVFLGDPMGWNMPDQVEEQLEDILHTWPEVTTFHLHLHNTRGTAPLSVFTALRTLRPEHHLVLDASLGGMAGCPYCGNGRAASLMPTEDLVDLLEELGIRTGVDLDRLIDAVAIAEEVVGHRLYGHVSKAGPRPRGGRRYAMDMPFIETLDEAQHFRLGPDVYEGALSPWKHPITSPLRP